MNNKCIRVLRIVSIMNRGGIETQIMNLYRKLDKTKFQFDFLVTRDEKGLFDDEIENLGGRIYRIPAIREVGLFKFIRKINCFFKKHQEYKIVHCHMNTWSGLFLNIALRNKVPVRIAQSHSAQQGAKFLTIGSFFEKIFKNVMKLFIKRGATHFWAVGRDAGEWLYDKKIAQEKMEIIPNAKDLEAFKFDPKEREALRKVLNIPLEAFIIGHVGSFSPVKNHTFLIDIFKSISKDDKECVLCLVGDGVLRKEIENQVLSMQIEDQVLFLGLRNDVNKLMSVFDVLVLPSIFEGVPNVVIEAQAASLPCIVSDSVTREVDMGMGLVSFMSLKQSEDSWAGRILNFHDKENRLMFREKKCDKRYDINLQIKWLERFYEEVNNAVN